MTSEPPKSLHYAVTDPSGAVLWIGTVLADQEEATRRALGPAEHLHRISEGDHGRIRKGGAWRVVEGRVEVVAEPMDLAALRARVEAAIDAAAERARTAWVTPGAGQAMEYRLTLEEACRLLSGEGSAYLGVTKARFPFLAAEVEARGEEPTPAALWTVAAEVRASNAAWIAAGARIKFLRRRAKLAVRAAATPEEIEAAGRGIAWPAP